MIAILSATRVRRLYERANSPIARKDSKRPKINFMVFFLKNAP